MNQFPDPNQLPPTRHHEHTTPAGTRLTRYRAADEALPEWNQLWPVSGAGFENLGVNGQPVTIPAPRPGPDELLVRHDACGICFSDIKVIRAGNSHPHIHHDLRERPAVLGHEVCLTVIEAGTNLQAQYRTGDRFVVQPAIYHAGQTCGYGYELHGGFSRYSIVDWRVLRGDHGNYLVPIPPGTGYAEMALCEPWACVDASYNIEYRTHWQEGGTLWLAGDGTGVRLGRAETWKPAKVVLDLSDAQFAAQVRNWAQRNGVEVQEGDDGATRYDDIVLLGNTEAWLERSFARLTFGGVLNLLVTQPFARPIALDIGRIHYDRLLVVAKDTLDLSAAYVPVRMQLPPGAVMWILGAAGAMGQMHLLRALSLPDKPRRIVATNLRRVRMQALRRQTQRVAADAGIELVTLSHDEFTSDEACYARVREAAGDGGYDFVVVNALTVEGVERAATMAGPGANINLFAGFARGTLALVDGNRIAQGLRFTGASGSSIEEICQARDLVASGRLPANRSVAAIAGLDGVAEGLRAVAEGRFVGKIVIYPNLRHPLPLTPLGDLQTLLPTVYARLNADGLWTQAAEEELLELML